MEDIIAVGAERIDNGNDYSGGDAYHFTAEGFFISKLTTTDENRNDNFVWLINVGKSMR